MKVIILLILVSLSVEILDRSYYDALGKSPLIQSYPSAPAKRRSAMPSEDYPRNTTPIETPAPGKDSRRSMSVR
jgi:hypothetical protein